MANNFLPFCPTDIGTNLLTQSEYLAASDRINGVQPGIASSKLNNKSIRQSAFIISQIAQYLSDTSSTDLLDDANTTKLLAQVNSVYSSLRPIFTKYTSGSGTHTLSYVFFVASANATVGATYTNNTFTFTVSATISSGVRLTCKGNGVPLSSGTLTKSSGTGDSTITFYAFRMPTYMKVKGVGGGGGGGGSSNELGTVGDGGAGGNGGNTTFGSTLLVANGGNGGEGNGEGARGGTGGTATIDSSVFGIALQGGSGCATGDSQSAGSAAAGSMGACSPFGGAGGNGPTVEPNREAAASAIANSGSGGCGGGGVGPGFSGAGGAAGGYFDAFIFSPSSTYAYSIGTGGAAGAAGTAGTGGVDGGAGGSGLILVEEYFN